MTFWIKTLFGQTFNCVCVFCLDLFMSFVFFFFLGQRIKELQSSEPEKKLLRLGVETGGCSGFQYVFELDHKTNPDDRLLCSRLILQ